MKDIYDQFIGIYEEAFSKEWCEDLISLYENNVGIKNNRQDYSPLNELMVSDNSLALPYLEGKNLAKSNEMIQHFGDKFSKEYYNSYLKKYPSFPKVFKLTGFKIQKTLPGEGYHMWHTENELYYDTNTSRRFGVYTIYLNDVLEGGETEFLLQHKRIPPTQGLLCIFPSAYTHLHRGNPPLSGEKYIMTGWVELVDKNNYYSPSL